MTCMHYDASQQTSIPDIHLSQAGILCCNGEGGGGGVVCVYVCVCVCVCVLLSKLIHVHAPWELPCWY
jgi:hypothetical protein